MGKKTAPLLPYTNQMLSEFGERLKLARLRRSLFDGGCGIDNRRGSY